LAFWTLVQDSDGAWRFVSTDRPTDRVGITVRVRPCCFVLAAMANTTPRFHFQNHGSKKGGHNTTHRVRTEKNDPSQTRKLVLLPHNPINMSVCVCVGPIPPSDKKDFLKKRRSQ